MTSITRLIKTKSFWVALGGILTAVGTALAGHITWKEALEAVWAGFVVMAARDAYAKGK